MGVDLAMALPGRYYTDESIHRRELDAVFGRTWQYAGHVGEVAEPGDYFVFSVLNEPLFCVRDGEGVVRAFYNVCRHRGHELLQGKGNRKRIVCPYHAWTYGLNGQLQRAPNSQSMPGFDASCVRLQEVKVEVFCGFVFVNLDIQAESMAKWYPGVDRELREFVPDIDELREAKRFEIEERCNWKVSVENHSECYHCRLNHPTFSTGVVKPETYNILPHGHCLRHTTQCANLERMSYPVDLEANAHAGDYSTWLLWPGVSFQVYPGNVLNSYVWQPLGVDRVRIVRRWYTLGGESDEVIDRLAQQDLDTTVGEDVRLVESVQRGLNSRGYVPGPLVIDPNQGVNSEHSVQALHRWLLEALGDERQGQVARA